MITFILDSYREDTGGDYFQVLTDERYSLKEVVEFFRKEFELFRGEPISSRLSRVSSTDIGLLLEAGKEEISVMPITANLDDSFILKAWSQDGMLRRFHSSLKLRFEQQ